VAVASVIRQEVEDEFVPAAAQTVFVLSQTPLNARADLLVNGVDYDRGVDYGVVGNVLTWSGSFTLQPTDKLIVRYTV
jgi:hypothetical protein